MTSPLVSVAPAGPHADAKTRLAAAVEAARAEILELSHAIHADPEPAFEEVRAAERVAAAIRRHGYEVEHPAGSLPTAVRGVLRGGGGPGPRIGVLAEYDALPGFGHGCGHNTMAASGVGAAIALAALRDVLPGQIVFLGTPAEERGSGKQFMLDDGCFEGVDAALLFHPSDLTVSSTLLLASVDVEVVFTGFAAHAASEPWLGKNALDALISLFSSVGLWRQQLPAHARVHGIIREGGTAANIIPERTAAWFMLRSSQQDYFEAMQGRFRAMCEAAALATDTQVSVEFSGGSDTMKENGVLLERWRANQAAYLPAFGDADHPADPERVGSSDMGNVSLALPTIHPSIAICDEGVPGHSIQFRDAAASPRADEATLLAATLVAQTAWDLLADPSLVEAAWREFRGR